MQSLGFSLPLFYEFFYGLRTDLKEHLIQVKAIEVWELNIMQSIHENLQSQ
jgi:hypothetical protein